MIIAIDGPAGSGKSTVARAVAAELGFGYLDSGAMYRCVALSALRRWGHEGAQELLAAPDAAVVLGALASELRIELRGGGVILDGEEVTGAIRTTPIAEIASAVAALAPVRVAMASMQRRVIASGDWVAEGRDIGTVVAPEAQLKVFLTADPAERARRRAAELGADPQRILAEQTLRDARDERRTESPLRAAADAVHIDTSAVSAEEVAQRIAALARARLRSEG